jgi:hypothetical protein
MASDKKPSIYSDRSTIGSSDELDEYGVWVKSEPQDLSSVGLETQDFTESSGMVMDELPDFDTDFDAGLGENDSSGLAGDDFEVPDLDIPEPLELEAGSPDEEAGEALDFEDLSIPEETAAAASVDEGFTEVDMEDFLDGDPDDLAEPAGAEPVFETQEQEKPSGGADLSTQLLIKIADELSSIRNELSTLKKEFSAIRREGPGEDKGEAQKKGFFDEEEDEKIALTGDELDNILNTADFTEEAGADATEELPGAYPSPETGDLIPSDSTQVIEESALPDLLSEQDDIIGAEAELQAEDVSPLEFETENSGGAVEEDAGEEGAEDDDIVIDLDFDGIDPEALTEDSPREPEPSPENNIALDAEEFDINMDFAGDLAESEESSLPEDTGTVEAPDATASEESFTLPDEPLPEETEELRILREEGAKPMTLPPEDTSYLDEEAVEESAEALSLDSFSLDEPETEPALEESGFNETALDLSNAVIDEPDLSAGITENPLEEPSLDAFSLDEEAEEEAADIVVDLDFEEAPVDISFGDTAAEAGGEEPEISISGEDENLELDIPEDGSAGEPFPAEENFAQVIPEGFVVESDDSRGPLDEDLEEDILSEGDIDTLGKGSPVLDMDEPAGEDALAIEPAPSDDESLNIPNDIKQELKTVLSYMDQLLESLPEDKIEEFAKSEYFDTYKKLFKELGLD